MSGPKVDTPMLPPQMLPAALRELPPLMGTAENVVLVSEGSSEREALATEKKIELLDLHIKLAKLHIKAYEKYLACLP